MKFKVGDRVRVVKDDMCTLYNGKVGTIASTNGSYYPYVVQYDCVSERNSVGHRDEELELVEEIMNKYNLKEGDKYTAGGATYTIKNLTNSSFTSHNQNGEYICSYKFAIFNSLVDKGIKQLVKSTKVSEGKIVGYKLLKDTPMTNAGVVFKYLPETLHFEAGYYDGKYSDDKEYFNKSYVENNTDWFLPIYEPIKPTEVFVETMAGKVKVTKKEVILDDASSEYMQTKGTQRLLDIVANWKEGSNKYDIKVETFKVGCKTFHINDIPKLQAAIKEVE